MIGIHPFTEDESRTFAPQPALAVAGIRHGIGAKDGGVVDDNAAKVEIMIYPQITRLKGQDI